MVGMLLYLAMHSQLDISYSVSQVCDFTHDPHEPHVKAVKMIIRYLQATNDKGLILKPDKSLTLDSYVDADFTRLYGVEDKTDPISVKSRTGYIITIGGCPLVWKSKLQQLIALSMTEAETNAVCDMMRVLLPLHLLIHEMSTYLGKQRTYKSPNTFYSLGRQQWLRNYLQPGSRSSPVQTLCHSPLLVEVPCRATQCPGKEDFYRGTTG